MNSLGVVKRYAKALYEVAEAENCLLAVKDDMAFLKNLFSSQKEIREYCFHKKGDAQKASTFIQLAFIPYVSELTQKTLAAMQANGRLEVIPHLSKAFQELQDSKERITPILLESAQPLDTETILSIEQKMRQRIGHSIRLTTSVNPTILGGLRIHWENRILDRSIRGRLNGLKELLK